MSYEEEEEDWTEEENEDEDRSWLDADWQCEGTQKKSHLQKSE